MRAAPRHGSFAGTPWPFWPGCSDCGIGFAATYETGAEIRSLWTGGNLSKIDPPAGAAGRLGDAGPVVPIVVSFSRRLTSRPRKSAASGPAATYRKSIPLQKKLFALA